MTRWRWTTRAPLPPNVSLTLVLDSDDQPLIERVEESARAQGITLVRLTPDAEVGGWPVPRPLPEDYWETAE